MATYNRAETLRQTLKHLAGQSLDPACYEIIISDDGSPDNTQAVVEEARVMYPIHIIYHCHENHGVGYSQNRGLELANAPLVLLIADDIFLAPDALQEHIKTHDQYPEETVVVLGQVRQSPDLNQSAFLRTWDPFQFGALRGVTELPYYMFWACHISAKRNFILNHGMFREDMGREGYYAAHEDTEVGYRLHKDGLRILYNEKALGHHYHITTLEAELKRSYGRGIIWHDLHHLVPEPELSVVYHVLNQKTIGEHLRAISGPRREYLYGSDRNPLLLGLRYIFRGLLFNRITVPYFWLPILRMAENNRLLEKFLHHRFYRGVFAYHFHLGCRDGDQMFGTPGNMLEAN
jgi:GT2 family glycosyltransferase